MPGKLQSVVNVITAFVQTNADLKSSLKSSPNFKVMSQFRIVFLLLFLLQGVSTTRSFCQTSIPYGDNPQAGAYIQLNGVRHYYEVYGTGRPLLLIHGNSTATKGWAAQIEFFSRKYRVYSVDNRGRGKSDLGSDTLRFEQMASDMAAFIEAMKLDSVDIIGKSDGAIVALMMGMYHPAHIRRIVSFAANLQPDGLYPELIEENSKLRKEAERMLAVHDTTKNWEIEKQKLRLDEFQPHVDLKELRRIKVPVLVLSCDRDVIRLDHTIAIYKHLSMANLCIVPGEKHSFPRENPELFNLLVDGFLSKPFVPVASQR
jgi:pimeloyl-ACP methyl ester carboxylesterase